METTVASGYEKNKARLIAVQLLGKELSRRAKSACELCESTGISLGPREVLPLPEEPSAGTSILICESCQQERQLKNLNPERWRCLTTVMWSEVAPVQVAAVRILRRLAHQGVRWADDALDGLYLAPEVETWIQTNG